MFFLVQFMEDWYLYHPNSCPQILPTPHPSPVSVSVDFLAVGISENVRKISLFKDDRLEFALTSEEIFLDWKPHPLDHTLFLVTISLLIQEMRRLSLRSKEEILCFSVYIICMCSVIHRIQLFIYVYLFFINLLCQPSCLEVIFLEKPIWQSVRYLPLEEDSYPQ